jgi:histidinol-phosphate phosphatase family protein
MTNNSAIFLDRDGVINSLIETEDGSISPQSVEQFKLLPGVEEALEMAKETIFKVIVFSNQPDVGKTWRNLDDDEIKRINSLLKRKGVDAVYNCKHGPMGDKEDKQYRRDGEIIVCNCRKPQKGLLKEAVDDLDIKIQQSFVIGDSDVDLEAAERLEKKTGSEFRGKFILGKDSDLADQRFDNLKPVIKSIVEENLT